MTGVYVRMRLGSERYAMPIESVHQVDELAALSPIPGAGGSLLGIRNLDGQVLPVFDLARVLGIDRDGPAPRVVVAERDGTVAGLAVDEVTDIGELDGDAEETEAEHLLGTVLDGGHLVGLVDIDSLFSKLAKEAA